jgi:hypothetical protein
MKAQACRRCIEAAQAAGEVVEFLHDPPAKCKACDSAAVMRAVSEQFTMRTPHWWVANGVVVVPIWIVELIKQRPKFVEVPLQGPSRSA